MSTLIAGGGLAGAAAACLLGAEATLIERETGPHHKICGGFISWEAQASLIRLGVDPLALGAASITAVRLVHGRTIIRSDLPGRGLGLSRRVLDEALLTQARKNGAKIIRGHTIRRLLQDGLEVDRLGPLRAARVFLATGKHNLRDAQRKSQASPFVGLKMIYRLNPAEAAELAGHVEIILFPGGYAGLQTIEAGLVNVCLLIDRSAFRRAGATWYGVIAHLMLAAPHLAVRLRDACPQLDRPLTIFGVPYGFVHEAAVADPVSMFRLGDQMGVIPSFSGDGMAIALHTAECAAKAEDAWSFHTQMQRDLQRQISRAMTMHRLGQSRPGLLIAAARAWPGALAWIARLTRVQPNCPI